MTPLFTLIHLIMTDTFFTENGFTYNKEGENDLTECYIKTTDDHTEFYTLNSDNPGHYDHIIMTHDGDITLEETITL